MAQNISNLNQLMLQKINLIETAVFRYETTQNHCQMQDRFINNLFLIENGRCCYTQDKRQVFAETGDIVWLPQESSYVAQFFSDNDKHVYGICFDFYMIDNQGELILPPQDIRVMAHDSDNMYKNLYNAAIEKQLNAHGDFAFRACAYNILAHLFNDINRFSDSDNAYLSISYAIRRIEEFPQCNDSVAALAAKCGISETSFRQKFKQYTGGLGPVEYRNYLRVEKSKDFLQIGHCSIESIADTLGFYDASYFIKIFKRMTGITPHEYRHRSL